MILRFFNDDPLWQVDPQAPKHLLIQASHIAGSGVTFEKVAEKQEDPDLILWVIRVYPSLNTSGPYSDSPYSLLVGRPSVRVKLVAPHGVLPWSVIVNSQTSILLPEFEPNNDLLV